MKCGGTSADKVADDEVKDLCNQLKSDVLAKLNRDSDPEMFEAITYMTQVVAGMNYFVKIQLHSNGECVHARIYRPLPHQGNPEVHSVIGGLQKEDSLEYF
ncbi:hypothetical protein ACF0H5_009980 [Mactra antiquata]